MQINTSKLNLTSDLLFVIRNVGRPGGFDRAVWSEEIDTLRERGAVQIVRATPTNLFIKFITE